MTLSENHPFSALSRQIEQLLWSSIIVASAAAAVSLVNMGRLSMFMAPIMFGFTVLHNGVLLGLLSKDRKKEPEQLKGTLAPTATKGAIITAWLLFALWCLVVATVIIVSVLVMANNQFEGWERLAGYVEIPLEVAEICLLLIIALKFRTQRKRTFTAPATVDWVNYQTTGTTA